MVTLLHEFAHAIGRDEYGAIRWSINLFKQVFPTEYARLTSQGHTLIKPVKPKPVKVKRHLRRNGNVSKKNRIT